MKNLLSIIRWKFVIPVGIILAALIIFFVMFFDPLLARGIEHFGSKINGAKVDVSALKTKIFQGRITIGNLQVTDKENVMKNIVEMGPMAFELNLVELLKKHVIIPQATLDGIQFNTNRKTSGKLPVILRAQKANEEPSAASKLVAKYQDRFQVSFAGVQDQAKAKIEFDPKELNITKQADALKEKSKALPDEWKAKVDALNVDGRLKQIETDLKAIQNTKVDGVEALTAIPESLKKLKQVRADLDRIKTDVKGTKDSLTSELKTIKGEVLDLKNAKQKDIDDLLSRLNLDFANPKKLAEGIIGPVVLQRVRKGLEIMQTVRQHMPSKKDEEKIPPKPRFQGVDIYFPTPAALPRFWLAKAGLSGQYENVSASGQLTDVTTNPSRIGKPTELVMKGSQGQRRFMLDGVIDHVTDEKKASIELDASQLAVSDFIDSGLLATALAGGVGQINFALRAEGENAINGGLKLILNQLKIKDDELFKAVGVTPGASLSKEDQLKTKLLTNIARGIERMPAVDAQVKLSGTWADPDMDITTNLTSELAKIIKASVGDLLQDQRKELEAKLDTILNSKKSEIDAQLNGLQTKLNESFGGFDSKIQQKVNEATGINLSPGKGSGPASGIKIPSLDKLFKK